MGTSFSKLLSIGQTEICYPAAKSMLPEVWHIVMDHLVAEGDYSSIEACSLVSRPWRPIAQQRMINKVTLPNLTVAAEFLVVVPTNPHIGSYVRELHLNGDGARVPFRTFYAILAAVPRLHYLALCDLSFLHWLLNKILLNPIECLNLAFIGVSFADLGRTSLQTVRLDVLGPVRHAWRTHANVLKQLSNTVRELSLGLILGSPDAPYQNLALAHPLFTRFEDLERLTFTSPSDSTCVEVASGMTWRTPVT
ncbi:hypothetical protein PHLGIDRAFT_120626 [Phlebiopsis gigantea 11061_1 CR5-6]|uniref:F-box domain-containing protein n=1 Tax=Phlebiopsis gigantea (strain 11061_1 CR5-6) TaxID=745531 RepID=A0A0C3NI25_PHLG1|nr:hypothetical protein PHLGIDRAFT_120626 [Phlebiopsis gigantea 11061_1 CR5-6]